MAAFAAIGPALKLLGSQIGKKALMQGAKSFAKDKIKDIAKNKAKNFVKGKLKGKKKGALVKSESYGGKGGALVRRPSSALSKRTSPSKFMNIARVAKGTPGKSIGYEKLTESVSSIVKITEELNLAQQEGLNFDAKREREKEKDLLEARRKRRERLLESGKKILSGAASTIGAVGKAFNIFDFFNNILLGGAILALLNLLKGTEKTLYNLSKNFFRFYKILPYLLKALLDPFGIFGKIFNTLTKPFRKFLKRVGGELLEKSKNLIKEGLEKLGRAILEFAQGIFSKLMKAAAEVAEKLTKPALEFVQSLAKKTSNLAKEALEKTTKRLTEIAAQETAEKVARETAESAARETAESAARETVETAARETVETAAEKAAREAAEREATEAVAREIAGSGSYTKPKVKPRSFLTRVLDTGSAVGNYLVEGTKSNFNFVADATMTGLGKIGSTLFNAYKSVGSAIMAFPGNVVNKASEIGSGLKDLASKTQQQALYILQNKIMPTVEDIVKKDDLIGKIFSFIQNPGKAKDGVLEFVAKNFKKAQTNKQLLGLVDTLKKARQAGGSQLGPLDKIIMVIESIIRYGLGESPVNAIGLALANMFGYAAGFAAASMVPGLGQSGIFNLLGGVAGSIVAEKLTEMAISSLLKAAPALGQIEDPIAAAGNFGRRPLMRDPAIPWEKYKQQWGQKKGVFFNREIFPLKDKSEDTEQAANALTEQQKSDLTQSQESAVQPQTKLMGGGVGKYAPLFDLIAKGEGGYNSINRGSAGDSPGGAAKYFGKNLTDMTVGEIMDLQAQKKVHAVGKYQIVAGTMKDFVARGGVSRGDMFNAKTQEKFPHYVVYKKRPTVAKYLEGKASLNDAILALSAEFASIGVPEDTPAGAASRIGLIGYPKSFRPKGTTFYAETSNRAHTTPEDVGSALQRIKGGPQVKPPSTEVSKIMKEKNVSREEAEQMVSSDMLTGPGPADASYSRESSAAELGEDNVESKGLEPPQGGAGSSDDSSSQETTPASLAPPTMGNAGSAGMTDSVQRSASYEQGAEQTIAVPLPQQQDQQQPMIPSKSRTIMLPGSNNLDRYYKSQLLGFLYKQG